MSVYVPDVLYIKTIEKEIGRKLDDMELEIVQLGEPIFLQKRNSEWISRMVPMYRFPWDLMVQEVDLALLYNSEPADYFECYLGVGHGGRRA